MKRKFFVCLFAFLLCFTLCFSQVAKQPQTQSPEVYQEKLLMLSQEIHTLMERLPQQSVTLTVQSTEVSTELKALLPQVGTLQTTSNDLDTYSVNTNELLSHYWQTINEYENCLKKKDMEIAKKDAKAKLLLKIDLILMGILVLMLAAKIVFTILAGKGVKLPYLLNLWV